MATQIFTKLAQVAILGSTMVVGGFAVEASAAGYMVNAKATTYNYPGYDRLNLRKWPAAHSAKQFKMKRNRSVVVKRCIIKSGADWCLVHKTGKPWKRGWVNGRFIISGGQNFAAPHYKAYGWH